MDLAPFGKMILWGGLGCCIGSAGLYLVSKIIERDVEVLKSVIRVDHLKDLAVLLDTTNQGLPLFVNVSGEVFSEKPIHCEQSGLKGVIVKETAVQHFKKKDDENCKRRSVLMLSRSKEVPWYLNDGTERVFVVCDQDEYMSFTVASDVFLEPGSLEHGTLGDLPGLDMLGVTKTERVLPVGTRMIVVGEALKDDIGTIRIQRPLNGYFFITSKNLDQLISEFEHSAESTQVTSIVFAVFGIFLLAGGALQFLLDSLQHKEGSTNP